MPVKAVSKYRLEERNLTFEFHHHRPLTGREMERLVAAWLADRKNQRTRNERIIVPKPEGLR